METKKFDLSTVDGCFNYFEAHISVSDTSPLYEPCADMTAFYNGTADFHNKLTSSQKDLLREKVVKYIEELYEEYSGTNYIGAFGHCYIYEGELLQKAGLSNHRLP